MATIPLALDGYTDLPPGKIANVVTYLELAPLPPPTTTQRKPPGLEVRPIAEPSTEWFRDIYRRVGEDRLWFSAAMMSDAQLAAELTAPETLILALERGGSAIGIAELRFGTGDVEVVTFGVVPEAVGIGAAGMLMDVALSEAARSGTRRVWLHTCSFDHPAAIPFYLKRGFRAFKYAIEVVDDPRLTGVLPATAAPHVPIVRPAEPAKPD
jgi:GNAT superfamily N-acetyltransferase